MRRTPGRRARRLVPRLACWLALAAGCASPPAVPPDTAASLDGQPVPYSSFEEYLQANAGEPAAAVDPRVLSALLDQFLNEELLLRLAVERGIVPPGASRRDAVEALVGNAVDEVSPRQVEEYYAAHPRRFELPERVVLRQILVRDRATAQQALARLAAGADFAALARELSVNPGAAAGGMQGVLSRQELPPAFGDRIFALAPGQVSGIVEADYGFHIFLVEQRLPAEHLSLAEATPIIREEMERQSADERLAALVAAARERYNPELYEENLPFRYRGAYGSGTVAVDR